MLSDRLLYIHTSYTLLLEAKKIFPTKEKSVCECSTASKIKRQRFQNVIIAKMRMPLTGLRGSFPLTAANVVSP